MNLLFSSDHNPHSGHIMKGRYVGIDYLRAFFSVCVVATHSGYVMPSLIFNEKRYLEHKFVWSDFANFYLLLLAVPVFFIISNYLFSKKTYSWEACNQYIIRIAKIAFFWILLYNMFLYAQWKIAYWLPRTVSDAVAFIISGGHTIYYFFISLMLLTVITHFAKLMRTRYVVVLFVLSTIIVLLLPLISMATGSFSLSAYYNPMNFIPYPFAAILVARFEGVVIDKKKGIMLMFGWLALCVASIVIDWRYFVDAGFFKVNLYAVPAYSRVSLIFISMAVLYVAIKVRPKNNFVIAFMSRYSLALYCLHTFFTPLSKKFLGDNLCLSLLTTILLSYVTAIILLRFLRREIVM